MVQIPTLGSVTDTQQPTTSESPLSTNKNIKVLSQNQDSFRVQGEKYEPKTSKSTAKHAMGSAVMQCESVFQF